MHIKQRINFIEQVYNALMEQIYFILDEVEASIYWKDLDGRYLGCNKFLLEMGGLKNRSDLIGKTDKEQIWKDIAPELEKIDNLVIKEKKKYEIEEKPLTAHGNHRTYLTTKTPLYNTEHEVIGIIGVSVDIPI